MAYNYAVPILYTTVIFPKSSFADQLSLPRSYPWEGSTKPTGEWATQQTQSLLIRSRSQIITTYSSLNDNFSNPV